MEKNSKWFENTVFYEIYVPSFCDGNGDGIGDLPGVTSKMDYLKELGVGAIWLTPFYPSPLVDNGYDVSDYFAVHERYGTEADFDRLLEAAHDAGIRVIVDMVLNHTSTSHAWFLKSREDQEKYRDYYIWREKIPNNWESFFDGGAWEYDENRRMYYYHAFSREQACLNWSNPAILEECKEILRFWLDKGVDGFRLDVINFLKTDKAAFAKDNPCDDGIQKHIYDKNQKGVREAVAGLSAFVHTYPDTFLLGEIGDDDLQTIQSYTGKGLLDAAFNFNLGSMEKWDEAYLAEQVIAMEAAGINPTLFFSSHDMRRHFSRLCGENVEAAKLLALFLLTAKGIPFLYQGEEMPLADVRIESSQDLQDAQGRYAYEKLLLLGKTEEEAFGYARERTRDYARGLIDWDLQREGGLQELYQSLLTLRREHEALRTGKYGKIAMNGHLLYFERIGRREKIAVTIDFSLTGMISAGYGGNPVLLEIKGGNGCMGLVEKLV
ncbi:MAG: glucohydrolase [Lachnospiraceae bacterium]|nr:glucohydrolase [Lachnospiraceae bacterium]